MKKKNQLLILLISCISLFNINAQELTENEAFDLSFGYEQNGFLGRFSYNRKIARNGMIRFGGQYNYEVFDKNLPEDLNINLYFVNLEYYHNILNLGRGDIVISLGIGALGGYEEITKNEFDNGFIIEKESDIFYGFHGGIEIDKFLAQTDKRGNYLSLIINARENYFLESLLGNYQFNASLGIRYNF